MLLRDTRGRFVALRQPVPRVAQSVGRVALA
jgi:hypothetical protein